MEQYISKSALVAEIDRLRKIQPTNEFQPKEQNKIDWLAGKEFAIITLQVFLDTLEVKEVDLEKKIDLDTVIDAYMDKNFGEPWDGARPVGSFELAIMAEHFFELGIQVSNKARKGE